MTGFRYVLIAMTVLIYVFTMAAVANSGINLITPFLTPILALSWQGQFNFDFTCYLVLSASGWHGAVASPTAASALGYWHRRSVSCSLRPIFFIWSASQTAIHARFYLAYMPNIVNARFRQNC